MRYIKYILTFCLFVIMGIVYAREAPVLKKWLLDQIQIVSSNKAGIEIKAREISFSFFPPGFSLEKISITPKSKELLQKITPISVDEISLSLGPLALLSGRFEIGKIQIIHPVTNIFIKSENNLTTPLAAGNPSSASKNFELPWNDIINIPIRRIVIKKGSVQLKLDEQQMLLKLENFGINFEKSNSAAKIEIFAPQFMFKKAGIEKSLQEVGFATRIILEKQAAEISAVKVSMGQNFIMARGVARGNTPQLQWDQYNLRVLSHLQLEEIQKLITVYLPNLKLPTTLGTLNFEVIGAAKKPDIVTASLELDAQNLQVNQFKIGNFHTKSKLVKKIITSEAIKLQTTAGNVQIKDLTLSLNDDSKFSARVQTDSLELRQTLQNLGVGNTPLHFDLFLKSACEGIYKPQFRAECAGEVGGRDFEIHTLPEKKTIVALKDLKVITRFILEKNKITFPDGEVQMGTSRGRANGFIDLDEGFKFNFETDGLNFSDIHSLADLKYEGALGIKGFTEGDGHAAIMDMHGLTSNFWFENYNLGAGEFDLRYEKSNLTISNLKMFLKNSNYDGHIQLKLDSPTSITTAINMPRLNLNDLSKSLERHVKIPFVVDGQGSATVEASGPMDLSKLTYKINSQFDQGIAYGETFQNFIFNVHAKEGHAYTDEVRMKKGDGLFILKGDVSSQGNMSLFVKGQDLHLTDFEHVKSFIGSLDGRMQMDLSLQDKILEPKVSLRSLISQTTLNQEPLEDSTISLDVSPESFAFDAELFNHQIKTLLQQPRKGKSPFSFKFETSNWDFSQFLSAFSGSDFKRDYETNVTVKANLSSESGDFWESRGEIRVPKFYVRHGTSQMQNVGPILVKFNDGLVNIESLSFKGDNTEISVSGTRNKKDALNININGQLELSLFNFLTPFFKDMTGGLNINSQIAGTTSKPEFLGTALINKGFFKLKEFPHAFEDVSADILFSQSRIVINKIKGALASGDFTANGNILLRGTKDVPIDLSGELNKATMNIPEGLQTKGTGTFSITGNWFPYLLKAEYIVDSGIYTKNFGGQENSIIMKRSAFLPKGIQQKEAGVLELDLSTHFSKGVMIKNSLMEAEVKGDLEVKGDPAHAILKGEINASPNGKLFFRETPFAINLAKAKFNNPAENNPILYASGTSRVRDWDITLLYQGNLDKYELKLSSSPPLPEKSIISLLALGLTDDSLEKSKSSDQLALQTYQAGSVVLAQNPLIQDFKKKAGVNLRLAQTVDDTRNTVMPRFVAEKQWTPKLSTSVGRTFGDKSSRDVSVEYKFNRNFSVLGSYEQRDYDQFSVTPTTASSTATASTSQTVSTQDILGVNLIYQKEFR